jgi:hypothetical protein
VKDKAFFFGSYEGYRLDAGINIIEAVPSDFAWARAVPVIASLRPGFLAPTAFIATKAAPGQDLGTAQIQTPQTVREDSFSSRLDMKFNSRWSSYARFFGDRGTSDQPNNVAGQVIHTVANPVNAVFNLQGILSNNTTNEFKIGYNGAPTQLTGFAPVVNGYDFSTFIINTSGSVANSGIAGQGATSGLTVPGGLIRANSAQNGRGQPYTPYSISFIDNLNWTRGNHAYKFGGELRLIRLHRQTGRHHLLLFKHPELLGEYRSDRAVSRRPVRTLAVLQQLDGPSHRQTAVLHCLRAGRVETQTQRDLELRLAL